MRQIASALLHRLHIAYPLVLAVVTKANFAPFVVCVHNTRTGAANILAASETRRQRPGLRTHVRRSFTIAINLATYWHWIAPIVCKVARRRKGTHLTGDGQGLVTWASSRQVRHSQQTPSSLPSVCILGIASDCGCIESNRALPHLWHIHLACPRPKRAYFHQGNRRYRSECHTPRIGKSCFTSLPVSRRPQPAIRLAD